MLFFFIAVLAGVLTVLAPCVLPLLPIVIGSSNTNEDKKISAKSVRIIGTLSLSVIVFTLLLKASTLLIDIPNSFWTWFSGGTIVILGLFMLFPKLWTSNYFVLRFKKTGDKKIAEGHKKKSSIGDYIVGISLGPIFSTCSPTYLFIIATVLPAGFLIGFSYLIGFVMGLATSLLLVAYFGQSIVNKITKNDKKAEIVKKIFGVLILLVGISIITGFDKKIEAWILDSGYGATINLEQDLIDKFKEKDMENETEKNIIEDINPRLQSAFPDTDWSKVDPSIENILSGGPGKDGIPAIDNPTFESINSFNGSNDIQAVVLKDDNNVKAYPYNILTWHEIVNDKIDGQKVSVTFCPLCGSAVVYSRELDKGDTTFGVSGFLIESNMVMYDRDTESLWQQSTGKAIAGEYLGTELENVSFQLMKIGDIKEKYPESLVLSEQTGFSRDYSRNPYAGYESTDRLIFDTSSKSNLFEMKEIMVIFKYNDQNFITPMNNINEDKLLLQETNKGDISISKEDGEIKVLDVNKNKIPFYFEMWFSAYAQHGDDLIIVE